MGIEPTFLLYESSVLPLNYIGLQTCQPGRLTSFGAVGEDRTHGLVITNDVLYH